MNAAVKPILASSELVADVARAGNASNRTTSGKRRRQASDRVKSERRDGARGLASGDHQDRDLIGIGARREPDLGLDEHGQGDRQERIADAPESPDAAIA